MAFPPRIGRLLRLFSLAVILLAQVACAEAPSQRNPAASGTPGLVIHEWGTFTSLQDENGEAISGINGDDEPVPEFVHRIANLLILSPEATIPIYYQGAPACHPDVTMRLETPVVYFHPARDAKLPLQLDVNVAFNGGWLSEYYPDAVVAAPGVDGRNNFGRIRGSTVGRLSWQKLTVGSDHNGPATESQVWLAPRDVQAAGVTTKAGESEQFLFYRGVGHVDSPVRVVQDKAKNQFNINAVFPMLPQAAGSKCSVRSMWLVDVRDKTSCAFRRLDGFEVPADGQLHKVGEAPAAFDESAFNKENLAKVCAEMRTELIADGLAADEADALLNTWKLSYFQSPGLRVFYLLPRSWTDHVLPMQVSAQAQIKRIMIGRVELVTPQQRALLKQIATGPASKPHSFNDPSPPAADFRAYEQLGRFRNALLLDEQKRRPTAALTAFTNNYGLQGYRPQN